MPNRRIIGRIPVGRIMKPMAAVFRTSLVEGQGNVMDLSQAGMFIASETLPEPGEGIRVVFEDASGAKLDVRGTVRWNTGPEPDPVSGFGIQLHKPGPEYLVFCQAVVEARGEAYSPA